MTVSPFLEKHRDKDLGTSSRKDVQPETEWSTPGRNRYNVRPCPTLLRLRPHAHLWGVLVDGLGMGHTAHGFLRAKPGLEVAQASLLASSRSSLGQSLDGILTESRKQ